MRFTTSNAEPLILLNSSCRSGMRIGRDRDGPLEAVVRDEYPVLLQALQYRLRRRREPTDVECLLQPEALAHPRQAEIGVAAGIMRRRVDVSPAHSAPLRIACSTMPRFISS